MKTLIKNIISLFTKIAFGTQGIKLIKTTRIATTPKSGGVRSFSTSACVCNAVEGINEQAQTSLDVYNKHMEIIMITIYFNLFITLLNKALKNDASLELITTATDFNNRCADFYLDNTNFLTGDFLATGNI